MTDLLVDFLYWTRGVPGTILVVLATAISYFSACILASLSEDVERLSLKITDSALNILLTWVTVGFVLIISGLSVRGMEFPGAPRGGYYAVGSVLYSAIIIPIAFWFFERTVICYICYRVAKRRDSSVRFFGKDGFKLIPLRNR